MANIKFSYLYRDGANNKNHNFLIFANPDDIDIKAFETLIQSNLIEGMWFYANEWKIPDLHFKCWNDEIDHAWHEFDAVEYINEPPNCPCNLIQFIAEIKQTHWYDKIYKPK